MIESLHHGFDDSDPEMQQTTIQYFADWVERDQSVIPWVRHEFSADLESASVSSNASVAEAALSLLDALDESEADPFPE